MEHNLEVRGRREGKQTMLDRMGLLALVLFNLVALAGFGWIVLRDVRSLLEGNIPWRPDLWRSGLLGAGPGVEVARGLDKHSHGCGRRRVAVPSKAYAPKYRGKEGDRRHENLARAFLEYKPRSALHSETATPVRDRRLFKGHRVHVVRAFRCG